MRKKIKEKIKIYKNENTVKFIIFKFLASLILSLIFFLDSLITFQKNIRPNYQEVYFNNIQIKNIAILFISFIVIYIVITIVQFLLPEYEKILFHKKKDNRKINKKSFIIFFAIILLMWMPTILIYFPGGLFYDTYDSLAQVLHIKRYMNANPLRIYFNTKGLC